MRFIYTKAFAIFAACLIILVIGLFLQVKGVLQPIEYGLLQAPRPLVGAAKAVTAPVKNFFTTAFTIRKIVRENADLTAKVALLQEQLAGTDQYKTENVVLKKELGFVQSSKTAMQPCTVLNGSPPELSDAMVISCGEGEGIVEGQAVVSQGYLVGKILHVGKYTSTALLLTNSSSAIDAKLSKNDTQGVVNGSFGSGAVFGMVSQNADLQKGDLIVTAGINSRIAKNLLIGEVGDVLSKPNDLFKRVSIATPVNFHDISYVFVAKQ
jgi:rod shape-determining protein MreC